MYVLGISSYSHEASCSLIKDGELKVLLEEERLSREKHTWKYPQQAIEQCLAREGITIHDVAKITFFWSPLNEVYGNIGHVLKYFPQSLNLLTAPSGGQELSFGRRVSAMHNVGRRIQQHFKLPKALQVGFVEHHLAHAASVFLVSPFEEAAILTIDGRGESTTTMMAVGYKNKIQKIKEIQVPHSLGHFYAAITDYLGFRPFFDEWKVMGMSAYGNDTFVKEFGQMIRLTDDGGFRLNLKYFQFHTHGQSKWLSDLFLKKFGPARKSNDPYDQKYFDIAYALQKVVENTGVHLAQHLQGSTGLPNLCMTGGVVLNCLMNKRIIEETAFKNYFFQPIANDAGTSFGSALYYYHQNLDKPRKSLFDSVYLGSEFTNDEIERVLIGEKVKYRKSPNIAAETAKFIADGKIVGDLTGIRYTRCYVICRKRVSG